MNFHIGQKVDTPYGHGEISDIQKIPLGYAEIGGNYIPLGYTSQNYKVRIIDGFDYYFSEKELTPLNAKEDNKMKFVLDDKVKKVKLWLEEGDNEIYLEASDGEYSFVLMTFSNGKFKRATGVGLDGIEIDDKGRIKEGI